VKQNDLGEYAENVREKQNIQIYKIKHQLSLKPRHRDVKHKFPTQEGSNQNSWFLNDKTPYSPLKPRQITSPPSNQGK
jgi:hypothetical protein